MKVKFLNNNIFLKAVLIYVQLTVLFQNLTDNMTANLSHPMKFTLDKKLGSSIQYIGKKYDFKHVIHIYKVPNDMENRPF